VISLRGFEGKNIAVFGLARTGLTAARALKAGGAQVACWDEKTTAQDTARAEGLTIVDLNTADWSVFDALLLSPGVPLTHPKPHWTVDKAKSSGVEIIGDVELFARTIAATNPASRPKVAAITGTNGKSTTTALLGHILREAGRTRRSAAISGLAF